MDLSLGFLFFSIDLYFCLFVSTILSWASPGSSEVTNPLVIQEMQKTWVESLGQEDPLEEGMATHSSVLSWRIPMDRGAWQAI